jgi:hypothetical protein
MQLLQSLSPSIKLILVLLCCVLVTVGIVVVRLAQTSASAESSPDQDLNELQASLEETNAILVRIKERLAANGGGDGENDGGDDGGDGGKDDTPAPAPIMTDLDDGVYVIATVQSLIGFSPTRYSQGRVVAKVADGGYNVFVLPGDTTYETELNESDQVVAITALPEQTIPITDDYALINPWYPPPPPGEYLQYTDRAAHVRSACSVYAAEYTPNIHVAAIGFTTALRT